MNVIYNSEHFSVLAYPAQQGFELVDKDAGRMRFLYGAAASVFRAEIDRIPEEARDFETIDALLDGYCTGSASPIVIH
ncbi:MAG: DUF3567 domain-containing protein [Azonexaceae bacterium]|mgnify:CR=1 FL=1|uniref:DUF3567 family protein n=1 Tax=Azonexus sp. R2A61 TaxID=2744443 RepID=UPI001F45D71B|nr:DUF3567 family protein [Azonexus sp. R2A61]MCE1239635.1 DUF3567 domain-containing protein [Azonexaceae bacterium]